MRLARFCAVVLTFASQALVHAASFDCKLAQTPREKAVCADPKLSAQDSTLAEAYTHRRAQLSPTAAAAVQQDQRDWLHYLDRACPTNGRREHMSLSDCLTAEYSTRLVELKPQPEITTGHRVYTRAHYSLAFGHPDQDSSDMDPGFGIAHFSWPQIDTPAPHEKAWNQAVFQRLVQLAATDGCKQPTDLDRCTDPGGQQDVLFSMVAVNEHYLIANFESETYMWGAAHPNTDVVTMNWSFDIGRTLRLSDIFAPGPAAKARLRMLISAGLKHSDEADMLWNDAEYGKGLAQGAANPEQWELSKDGITVTFRQYQVAAYAAGMPVVGFSWQRLQPLLAPGFRVDWLADLRHLPEVTAN